MLKRSADFLRRSKAAKKGWQKRRRKQIARRVSAKKGWLKRRQKQRSKERIRKLKAQLRKAQQALKIERKKRQEAVAEARIAAESALAKQVTTPEDFLILVDQWLSTNPEVSRKDSMLRSILDRLDFQGLERMASELALMFDVDKREIYTLWHSPDYPIGESIAENMK